LLQGTVVAAHGRQYVVSLEDGRRLHCFPRGKKSEVACGDRVAISTPSADQGCIEEILPRQSLLYRSNDFRQKLIAANLTQVAIVVACDPPFSEEVLNRCLIACEQQGLTPLIVLNKCDLTAQLTAAEATLVPHEKLGYRVLRLTARQDVGELKAALQGQRSLLVGQSGMGKSTITNALIPGANAATREISHALQSGKHTTTHATLYRLDDDSWLIDSPGLQEFGLAHLDFGEIEQAFPEFRPHLGQCRFRNCRHDREPDCAVRTALEQGEISPSRYATFRTLVAA
jgi:ribosome biogenesis GTPase / thiamine phosphate phosphatase